MYTKKEIESQIIELISDISEQDISYADIDTPFTDLGVDSLMALELSVHIEREYDIYLDEDDLMKLTCINDVFSIIDDRL
ncbi:acyl carrier protein [Cytobacillus firmus]|uniref:acyl carrier protein n=1 Tax=Cytobacillus firmus TaxID=1399 RepID=UPI0030019C71